jgi:transcription-repair coupling factor (superfamily II helicase)
MRISSATSRLAESLRHGGKVRVHLAGVAPETLPFLAAILREQTERRILLVARDVPAAESLAEALRRLLAGGREWGEVLLLPRAALSPYIDVSVDTRRALEALGTLSRLAMARPGRGPGVLVVPAQQLLARHPNPVALLERMRELRVGDEIDREGFLRSLAAAGYARVSSVYEEGTFAVRGSLVDLFSPGMAQPIRIDFFGDEVEGIATFVPETQMTLAKQKRTLIFPATEVVDRETVLARARKPLLALADSQDLPSSRLAEITDALRAGEVPPGSQAFMPLLQEESVGLADYLDPAEWLVLFDDLAAVEGAVEVQLQAEHKRYAAYRELGRLALPPEALLLPATEVGFEGFTRVNAAPLDTGANLHYELELGRPLVRTGEAESRLSRFEEEARRHAAMGMAVVVAAADENEGRKLAHLITGKGLSARLEDGELTWNAIRALSPFPGVRLFVSDLETGLESADLGIYLVTTREIFERKAGRRLRPEPSVAHQESMLALQEGDFVVHRDYGIGRFAGIERRLMGTGEYTCLKVEYAQSDALYVPIHNAGAVQRYVGSGQAAPRLDRLGSASWENRVDKVRKSARKLAINLLDLYARRQAADGYSFAPSDDYFAEFEASFPYEETPDQQRAIEEVLSDMEKARPMDRLVCGDVGFGKTEVAIRAAFKAILDGRQVAVLVPTTVLAEQHRISFARRVRGYPVTVESLSRFKGKREQQELLTRLAHGTVDVVIGTHRLLSKDVVFKSLGLVIIDEEHRFGVAHKERLKALRASVDVLSLTATPIPRTLHMALTGIRDLSVIQTAPPGRQDIETTVTHFDPDTIAEAIRFELSRGGQVFFLHNRVEDIETVREQLNQLVPEARIAIGHGQMREDQLERTMVRFMNGEADILLCTTIIESGLDMPSVNTLIVNNADRFGLAQLYQIRGRVGRSSRRAFAWFIVPPVSAMTGDARSRLATLSKFTAVGSGFQVANIDMELRGAGNLLGGEQSGQVSSVGFDMYIHLLQEAVEELKAEAGTPARVECHVDFPIHAELPEEYLPDRHQRLVFYRRIAGAETADLLDRLRDELRDRFGSLPEAAETLLEVAELKLRGQALGLARLEGGGSVVKTDLSMAPDSMLEGVLSLVRQQTVPLKIRPPHTLVAQFADGEQEGGSPLRYARRLIALLEESARTVRRDEASGRP